MAAARHTIMLYVCLLLVCLDLSCNPWAFYHFTEGGRLERELKYTETMLGKGYGSSGLIIVQTPEPNSRNVLTVQSLQQHLDAVLAATQVEVELFDK